MDATFSLVIIACVPSWCECLMRDDPHAREPPQRVASPKLLDAYRRPSRIRSAPPAAARGRMVAIWTQFGATIGPCPTR